MSNQALASEPRSKLLDLSGAAEYCGFSQRFLRRLVFERRVKFLKSAPGRGGRLFFRPEDLDQLISGMEVQS